MIKFILIIIGIFAAIAIIDYFKVFFIVLAVLTAAGFIAYKIYKKRKTAPENSHTDSKPEAIPEKPKRVVNQYRVAGVYYHEDTLKSMLKYNEMYDYSKRDLIDGYSYNTRIYKYTVTDLPIELVPEPDNPHDPNAIKVLLGGNLVGYIPAKDCAHISDIMNRGLMDGIHYTVQGGHYKEVVEDYDPGKDRSTYTMEKGTDDYGITLYIGEFIE